MGWGASAVARDQNGSYNDLQAIAAREDADTLSPQNENFLLSLGGVMRVVRHKHDNTESH